MPHLCARLSLSLLIIITLLLNVIITTLTFQIVIKNSIWINTSSSTNTFFFMLHVISWTVFLYNIQLKKVKRKKGNSFDFHSLSRIYILEINALQRQILFTLTNRQIDTSYIHYCYYFIYILHTLHIVVFLLSFCHLIYKYKYIL